MWLSLLGLRFLGIACVVPLHAVVEEIVPCYMYINASCFAKCSIFYCTHLPHCHDYANNLADYVFSIALSFFALGVFVMELYGCNR
jgi:hypothetical protein